MGGYATLAVPSTPSSKLANVLEPLKFHVTEEDMMIPDLSALLALVQVVSVSSGIPSLSSSKSKTSLIPSPSESKQALILAFKAFIL